MSQGNIARTQPVKTVTPFLALVLALGCGLVAANLYYAQPLVGPIGAAFGIRPAETGLLVTLTQLGYGLGLLFVVPLGDRIENRRLVVAAVCAAGVALIVMSTAPHAAIFLLGALALGVASTAVQVLLPYATYLTPEASRGRVLGALTSGLMLGIALARPLASLVTYHFGWRAVFALSAVLMAAIAAILHFSMPPRWPPATLSYRGVLRSLPPLLRDVPILRRRAIYHAALYASFSLFWTAVPLLLASERFRLSQQSIGLFALAGAGGVVIAPIAGWVADRGLTRSGTGCAMLSILCAFAIAWIGNDVGSVGLLILSAILIDAGLVTNFVLSQRVIYGARPDSRSRIGGLFTALFFLGGAFGSALATASFAAGGWPLTTAIGSGLAALALIVFAGEFVRLRSA
jgi:predicted MFS family arabinose efflux permease